MNTKILNWGILGTGAIAHTFARGLSHSKTGKLVGIASRSLSSADVFAKEFSLEKSFASYEALLNDKQIEAVYISTPHPFHAEWCKKAAEAGKHILCEKPLCMNSHEAQEIISIAKKNDVFLMEAFMYRCHPVCEKWVEIIRSGRLGSIQSIYASFCFNSKASLESRLRNRSLGGGGILDVGCYTTSISRLIAGAALNKPFADPIILKAVGHIGVDSGIDEYTVASLQFENGILAQLSAGVSLDQGAELTVLGSKGHLRINQPFVPCVEGGRNFFEIHCNGVIEKVIVETSDWLYAIEADTVTKYLDQRQASSPAPSWDDTLGNMKTLDRWREEIGLTYQGE